MNAVRLSHYPADPEFLEACDSLGLYVMNELSGWHGKHETVVGQKLVREMVIRDVNHPSVIWWSNGNEKDGIRSWTESFINMTRNGGRYCIRKVISEDTKRCITVLTVRARIICACPNFLCLPSSFTACMTVVQAPDCMIIGR